MCFALSSKLCFSNTSVKNYGVPTAQMFGVCMAPILKYPLRISNCCLSRAIFLSVNLLMRWKLIMFDSEVVDRDKELLNCCF